MLNHNQGNSHFMTSGTYDIYTSTEGGFNLKVLRCHPTYCLVETYDCVFPIDITEEEFRASLQECKIYSEELENAALLEHISYPINIMKEDSLSNIKNALEQYSCIITKEL